MPASIDITLPANSTLASLRLYAEGAIFWHEGATLFITDPHFGKADSFRHAGIAIPTTVLDHDLARLTRLLAASQATRLIVLGDFFHNRHSQSENTLATLETWRSQYPNLEIILVLGNHDLHAGNPPAHLNIQVVNAPFTLGPFQCHHLPQTEPSPLGYILAGHLHPYVILRDRDGTTLRLPSYIVGPDQAILPAFGSFTGGQSFAPSPNDRVFVISEGEIAEVPTSRQPRPQSARR
ncbi:MAG: ligase-associated DNA damage response endonuclease PdeM [Caldilineaceae bacterium]|nr:ligase-associated DNA damage response endonuclease PdeM [Caldilineaceae bacterium]